MDSKTEDLPAFTVVGVAARVSNDRPELIGALWKRFFEGGGPQQIPHRKSDEVVAVYTDYEGDHTKPYTMVVGCKVERVDALPQGLKAQAVPAGRFVVLTASGPMPDVVVNTWKHAYELHLDRTFVADFDRYTGRDTVAVHVGVR